MQIQSVNTASQAQRASSATSRAIGDTSGFGTTFGSAIGSLIALSLQSVANTVKDVELNSFGSSLGKWFHSSFMPDSTISAQAMSEFGEGGSQIVEGVIQTVADKPVAVTQQNGAAIGGVFGNIIEQSLGSLFSNLFSSITSSFGSKS